MERLIKDLKKIRNSYCLDRENFFLTRTDDPLHYPYLFYYLFPPSAWAKQSKSLPHADGVFGGRLPAFREVPSSFIRACPREGGGRRSERYMVNAAKNRRSLFNKKRRLKS